MDAAQLFDEHHAALYRYLLRLTGDPDAAADALQEAFARLLERRPREERLRAWLFTVATNVVREAANARQRRARLLERFRGRAPTPSPAPDPLATTEAEDRRTRVRAALAVLSDRERTVLLMREEGFAHREIAEAVGTTTGSVGTMIARALDKLAEHLPLDEEDA
jgi:RNA polymerase sigma-70 factor (ECF subfamily)